MMNPPRTNSVPDQEYVWLILIIATGLALRAVAIVAFNHIPESDELAYQSMALNLVHGNGIADGIADGMGNRAMYNVGYPLFVLAPVFALFGENVLFARVANALLGGLAIVLCYAAAKEAGAGKVGRLLATTLWALYLPASIFAVFLLKENLMIPLMLGVIWCALRLLKAPSYRTALACGALFGLLALTGNAALPLAAPAAFAILFTPASVQRKLSLSVLVLISAMLVAAPWMARNFQLLGAPVLNTNGGFNLYLGNNPAATGMFVSISDTPRGPTWEALRKEGELRASDTLKREAMEWIKANPSTFLELAVKKAAFFWTPPIHQGKKQSSGAEPVVRILWAIQFFVLVAGAVGGLVFASLRNRNMMVLWLAIASYTAVHMLFYVTSRYREAIMPVLCLLAAFGFAYLADCLKAKAITSKR